MRTSPSPRSSSPNRSASSASEKSGSRAGNGAASEGAAERELQALDLVVALVLQRDRVADGDRTHRRLPGQRQAGRQPQLVRFPGGVAAVDVAPVEEGRQARA